MPLSAYQSRLIRDAKRLPAGMHLSVKPWLCSGDKDACIIVGALRELPIGPVYRLDGAGCRDVDLLLQVYRAVRAERDDLRIALAAGLQRTQADVRALGLLAEEIRLVKGASDVLAKSRCHPNPTQALITLGRELAANGLRPGICTGDITVWSCMQDWQAGSAEIETPALPQALAQASDAPQPLRIYMPYGWGAFLFGAARAWRNAAWRTRLMKTTIGRSQ